MQTILGAGGAIGQALARELPAYTNEIRLVSRNPEKVNDTDELYAADLTKPEQVNEAVKGSDIVYLTVGLTYKTKIWQETWPVIMKNVIEACKAHGSRLVFFDNIYMYDPDSLDSITEENPVNPASKKGKVRAQIAQMVMDAHQRGDIQALIARSADFYGPSIEKVSVLTETVFNPLSQGKKAQIIGRDDVKHSYTYTPDAGKATALLGNTDDAYGEIWHLPTASNPMTMKELVSMAGKGLAVDNPKIQAANKFMVGLIGLFVPIMGELKEMYYQYDRDYVFKSDKFEKRFDFQPTSYEDGIKTIIERDYK